MLNHNLETVARLQRAVRPSAGYARSLARAGPRQGGRARHQVGHHRRAWARPTTRSRGALADLRGVGVDIVTIGQYLRPTRHHLPVARWWTPDEFDDLRRVGEASASPTSRPARSTRSSYHARQRRGDRAARAVR